MAGDRHFGFSRFISGFFIGIVLFSALAYGVTAIGGISFVVHDRNLLVDAWAWLLSNLGLAAVAFLVVFLAFGYLLLLLRMELLRDEPSETRVLTLDNRLDLLAGVSFGIGVIFTAIGLRSALNSALGELDQAQGAFEVLDKLVEGGILLALSTTIVGGIAGYVMRLIKNFWLGGLLHGLMLKNQELAQQQVLDRLEAIEAAVTSSEGLPESPDEADVDGPDDASLASDTGDAVSKGPVL